jgi:hypothetical protein
LLVVCDAAILSTNLAVTKFCLRETLVPEKRKPFAWQSSSPLSLFRLFRSGARLRSLCYLVLMDNLIQPVLGGQFDQTKTRDTKCES